MIVLKRNDLLKKVQVQDLHCQSKNVSIRGNQRLASKNFTWLLTSNLSLATRLVS